jgi:hypothetical protein
MDLLALSVPQQKFAASPTEIRPKQARAWLVSLPAANAVAMARQLYQALYAVNRVALTAQNRLELMTLYHEPVAAAGAALQVHLSRLTLPLPPKKAQLADFLRQLEVEMAYGYKLALQELSKARNPWAKPGLALSVAQAIYYLGRVLLRSYQVYRPCPAGVWQEIHALYDYAERGGQQDDVIDGSAATIAQRYKQALLLGLANPYQLPQNECNQVYAFLAAWAGEATISDTVDVGDATAHFLVDLNADAPPLPFPKDVKLSAAAHWRALDASGLAMTVDDLMRRLQKGEPAKQLVLGGECVGFACQDMLKRLTRFWGLSARRQYSRARREGRLSLCTGINAIHFFTTGQKPFAQPQDLLGSQVPAPRAPSAEFEPPYVDLDPTLTEDAAPSDEAALFAPVAAQEVFRVDSWRVRDEGAGGLSLRREGLLGTSTRVGDLLGLEDPLLGAWRIGVARWLRSADSQSVEMGVEMLSPHAEAVAIRQVSWDAKLQRESRFVQALLLPAIGALRKPATLLVPRGTFQQAQDLYLVSDHREARRVRPLTLLERTGSFEHVVFVEMGAHASAHS